MIYFICFAFLVALWFTISCKTRSDKDSATAPVSGKLSNGFEKSGDTIWFYDVPLNDVDANSFDIIDDYFFRDKNQVYFYETYRVSQDYFTSRRKRVLPLEHADPDGFVSLGEGYAKDKSMAWYLNEAFKVSDLQSMTVINHHFVKDAKTAYVDRKPVAGSDGKTFELISDRYAKDAYTYYYCTPYNGMYDIKPITCDYPSFVVIDYQYARDNDHVFYSGNKIPGADATTFALIYFGYSKDKQSVFYQNKLVSGADPETFSVFAENENSLGETVYAKDKSSIYINDKRFAAADVTTFRILNEKYTFDKNGVYFQMEKIKNADPSTFKVFPHFMGDADAEDKNHLYGEGKVVK